MGFDGSSGWHGPGAGGGATGATNSTKDKYVRKQYLCFLLRYGF